MYSTSAKTWIRSIAIDSAIVAMLVAGIFYSVPYTLQVAVFVLWWIVVLGLIASGMMVLAPDIFKHVVQQNNAAGGDIAGGDIHK